MRPFFYFLLLIFFCCDTPTHKSEILYKSTPIENETTREWIEGWLIVQENRYVENSNVIQLPFILSKVADSLKTLTTPILVMSGGPGNGSLHMANGFTRSPVGFKSDILVMDQRGTSLAKPCLKCPEIDSARIKGIKNGLYGKSLGVLHNQAVKQCYERWTGLGVDLNGYHTLESVQDIEDLRSILDIEKLILYGMSYSCKLMTAYAQTYPERVEALILDSPLPHDSHYDEEAYENMASVFELVLNQYSQKEDVLTLWSSYIQNIQDSVFTMTLDRIQINYTSNEVIDAAFNLLGDHSSLKKLTEVVERLMEGNHQDIEEVLKSYLRSGRQAKGMRYSTWIAEELPEEREATIERNQTLVPWLKDYPVNDVSFETAKYWKVKSIFDDRKWPDLSFNGPVMILSGEFDPWTPVSYGQKMKEKFPQATFIIYPEKTHLPGFTNEGSKDIYEFLVRK